MPTLVKAQCCKNKRTSTLYVLLKAELQDHFKNLRVNFTNNDEKYPSFYCSTHTFVESRDVFFLRLKGFLHKNDNLANETAFKVMKVSF